MSAETALAQACSDGALVEGWAFVAGFLEGAIVCGWDAERTADQLAKALEGRVRQPATTALEV